MWRLGGEPGAAAQGAPDRGVGAAVCSCRALPTDRARPEEGEGDLERPDELDEVVGARRGEGDRPAMWRPRGLRLLLATARLGVRERPRENTSGEGKSSLCLPPSGACACFGPPPAPDPVPRPPFPPPPPW